MKTTKPFYVDPGGDWNRMNLVAGLMGNPATAKQHPLERQATIVLAWLLDHSRRIADEVLERWFPDVVAAVERPTTIGARSWGTLRPLPETGSLYPDLSIIGSDRSFEILVELKIDAEIHYWPLDNGTRLYQPDAYWRSWHQNYPAEGEAETRRIATLTRSGTGVPDDERQFAWVDLRWAALGGVLEELIYAGEIEAEVAGVAKDVHAAIDQLVLKPATRKPDLEDPLLLWGYELLADLGPQFAVRLPAGYMSRQKPGVYGDYVGTIVYFESDGIRVGLWLYVTDAGTRYAPPEEKRPCLWVCRYEGWPKALVDHLASSGFVSVRDREGYVSERVAVPVDEIRTAGDLPEQVAHVLGRLGPLISRLSG